MLSSSLPHWQTAALAFALLTILAGGFAARRLLTRVWQVTNALNHMSQGLCMFDKSARIIICNRQYLDIYKLSPQVVKPGCTLRGLIEHRKQTGLFTGDTEAYCKQILDSVATGKTSTSSIDVGDGRRSCARSTSRCPMAAGSRRMRTSPRGTSCKSSTTPWPSSTAVAAPLTR